MLQKKIIMRVAIKEMETIKKEEEVEPLAVQVVAAVVEELVYPEAQYLQAPIAPPVVGAALVVPVGATSEVPSRQYEQLPVKAPAAEAAAPVDRSVYPAEHFPLVVSFFKTLANPVVTATGWLKAYPVAGYMQGPVKDPAAEAVPLATSENPVAHFPAVVSVFKTQVNPVVTELSWL